MLRGFRTRLGFRTETGILDIDSNVFGPSRHKIWGDIIHKRELSRGNMRLGTGGFGKQNNCFRFVFGVYANCIHNFFVCKYYCPSVCLGEGLVKYFLKYFYLRGSKYLQGMHACRGVK